MAAKYDGFISWFWKKISHNDFDRYWRMREAISCHNVGKLKGLYYLYCIKKMDSYNNASLGTHWNFACAEFASKPVLPHGLNGIIVSNEAKIGKNCMIYHQVTIGGWNGEAPIIGDNVLLGAGAKVIGGIKIGNNVKVGAGCVVTKDIPDNATVVLSNIRIIKNNVDDID